jgi:hypothetical protein
LRDSLHQSGFVTHEELCIPCPRLMGVGGGGGLVGGVANSAHEAALMQKSSPGDALPSMMTQSVEGTLGMYAATVAGAPLMHTAAGSTAFRE